MALQLGFHVVQFNVAHFGANEEFMNGGMVGEEIRGDFVCWEERK